MSSTLTFEIFTETPEDLARTAETVGRLMVGLNLEGIASTVKVKQKQEQEVRDASDLP